MTRLFCFDLDGTLVDTQQISRLAYREVGVEVPDGAWGRRWQEWLVEFFNGNYEFARAAHAKKTDVYYAMLINHPNIRSLELPAARIAREAGARDDCGVYCLTASTIRTAKQLLNSLGLGDVSLIANITYEARRDVLSAAVNAGDDVTYIDDHITNVVQLTRDVPGLHVIQYTGQSYEKLCEEFDYDAEECDA